MELQDHLRLLLVQTLMMVKNRQVVLITGASRGIGNTCATFLAKRGHAVYGTSRFPGSHPRMMDEFFEILSMDNLDEVSIQGVVSEIIEKEGRIDLVVCNTGKTINGAVENIPTIEALQQIDINFMGVARLIHAVLPAMRQNRSGTILVIGSILGRSGLPFNAYNAASEFALEGYVESLRLELVHSGVRIAMVESGSVHTGVDSNITLFSGEPDDTYTSMNDKVFRRIADCTKKGINPVVIARLVQRLMGRKKLKTRYFVGTLQQQWVLMLKRFLPSAMYEYLILKYLRIIKINKE